MAYDKVKSHGVTEGTPDNILLGAGTIHKGLKYVEETGWNFDETIIGATSGGSKVTITPEFYDPEIDGVLVPTAGLKQKVGETMSLETNMAELTPEIIAMGVVGTIKESSTVRGYSEVVSKARIEEGDYVDDFAYVGTTITGKPIIIVMEKALCTSGLELEGKNKEASVTKLTMECHGKLTGDLQTLPYHIYYPSVAALNVKIASAPKKVTK